MEWNNDLALSLISLYQERECLWNPIHMDYKNKLKRLDAWEEISEALQIVVPELKKKMESLLTSFRRERLRAKGKTGSAADEAPQSSWFAYRSMLFLQDRFSVKKTANTEDVTNMKRNDIFEGRQYESDDHTRYSSSSETVEQQQQKLNFILPNPPKLRKKSRADEAYDAMKEITSRRCRDASEIYGEHVASKHRKYSEHTRNIVEHLFGEIFFKADMGLFEKDATKTYSLLDTFPFNNGGRNPSSDGNQTSQCMSMSPEAYSAHSSPVASSPQRSS